MNQDTIKHIVEAAILAAGRPLSLKDLLGLFDAREAPGKDIVRAAIEDLREDYAERGIEVAEVASGYRIQVRREMSGHLSRLWQERPPRYTRALLETLALIAYRQPITRGEIEDVRGVAVSTNIIRTLMEREWIREVGHKDVPGKPAMFGTTREFLDYFGLKSLDQLPSLAELKDVDSLNAELDLGEPTTEAPAGGEAAVTAEGEPAGGDALVAAAPLSDAESEPDAADAADDASAGEVAALEAQSDAPGGDADTRSTDARDREDEPASDDAVDGHKVTVAADAG